MGKITAFNFITLNGFLNDANGDISWHRHGLEENQFASDSLESNNTLLFGRKTYEMMASYWPTQMALDNDPEIAKGMNNAHKVVFSSTLKTADWHNTQIISGDIVYWAKRQKTSQNRDMTILGSGNILTLLAQNGLIDEYMIMIDPVAIGSGNSIFKGIDQPLNLKFCDVQTFNSGVVLLKYIP